MRGIRFAAGLLLLIVIGAPTYFLLAAARRSEERSATQALLVTLQSLVFAYSADYGDCPHPNAGGLTLEGITSCDNQGRILDAWDRPLVYRLEGGGPGRRVILYSIGPDGRDEDGLGDDVTSGNPQISATRISAASALIPREITIPAETGAMGLPKATLDLDNSRAWEAAVNQVRLLVPTELTPDRYLTVLASPARTPGDVLYKAAYVRFSIPGRGGGAAGLLLAVCKSDQHRVVRQAAMAALTGVHLQDPYWGGFTPRDHGRATDSCPGPVLAEDAPQFAELTGQLLKGSKIDDLEWVIQCLVLGERDLPSGFEALVSDFAKGLDADQDAWSVQRIAHLLGRYPGPNGAALIVGILDRYSDFSPTFIEGLISPRFGSHHPLREPLATALQRFREKARFEPKYKHLCSKIEARLDR